MREWDRLTRGLIINGGGSFYFKCNGYFTSIISGATTGCHCFTLIIDWPPLSRRGLQRNTWGDCPKSREKSMESYFLFLLLMLLSFIFIFFSLRSLFVLLDSSEPFTNTISNPLEHADAQTARLTLRVLPPATTVARSAKTDVGLFCKIVVMHLNGTKVGI